VGASVTLVPERVGTRAEQTTTHASAKLEFIRATTYHEPGPQGSGFFLFAAFPSLILSFTFPLSSLSEASALANADAESKDPCPLHDDCSACNHRPDKFKGAFDYSEG
jgi:hypothetical protein